MTTEQHEFQGGTDVSNRLEELGPGYVSGLADSSIFSENGRPVRKLLYEGLPKALTPDEVDTLGVYVIDETLQNRPFGESPRSNGVRALKYVGHMALLRGDEVTSGNVARALSHSHGVKGKIAAAALWYDKNIRT